MPKRKPLLLAFAAAGFLSGFDLREASSGEVFVPELAVVDGALCRMPAGRSSPSAS